MTGLLEQGITSPLLASVDVAQAPFAAALVELGHRRSDLVVLSADLSNYTDLRPFASTFPDRFIQVGMAEQNMMGIAGGLARAGLFPIAVTYGVFATRRAFDQVAMALGTGGVHAAIVAFLPGITTPFRVTHQATDDLALMRALPPMTVIDPLDATEVEASLLAVAEHDGPVYLRGLRGQVERRLDPQRYSFQIGRGRLLLEGDRDLVIGTGLGTAWALDAAALLADQGHSTAVLHIGTLKPIDDAAIRSACEGRTRVHVVENHSIIGGLASAVCEVLAEAGSSVSVVRHGVPDCWAPAGSLDHIKSQLSLDASGLARAIKDGSAR